MPRGAWRMPASSARSWSGSSRRSPTRAAWRGRSAARAVPVTWEPRFRDAWVAVLDRAATAVRRADPVLAGQVRDDLGAVANRLPDDDGGHPIRPAQGALVLNLLNIVDAMAPVSAIQPIRVRARRPAGRRG